MPIKADWRLCEKGEMTISIAVDADLEGAEVCRKGGCLTRREAASHFSANLLDKRSNFS